MLSSNHDSCIDNSYDFCLHYISIIPLCLQSTTKYDETILNRLLYNTPDRRLLSSIPRRAHHLPSEIENTSIRFVEHNKGLFRFCPMINIGASVLAVAGPSFKRPTRQLTPCSSVKMINSITVNTRIHKVINQLPKKVGRLPLCNAMMCVGGLTGPRWTAPEVHGGTRWPPFCRR